MKLGFIGCGNMATAMIKGIISNGIVATVSGFVEPSEDFPN